jgi:IrrE N-terminal-like domain
MPKLVQDDLDIRPEDLVAALLDACDIREPPTDDQMVFDFLKLRRDALPGEIAELPAMLGLDPKIRAMLDLNERLVLVHPGFVGQRERFAWASLHEVGHYVLPDHRELLFKCSWKDLGYQTQRRLEIEANRFAADLIFQGHTFIKEALDSELSLSVPLNLKKRYRASYEAAIGRYVERNPKPCALVVYRPSNAGESEPPLKVQYSVRSASWTHFAYIVPRQVSPMDSPEHQLFYSSSASTQIVEAEFIAAGRNQNGPRIFPSQLFSNSYSVFQLIHPPL